MEGALCDSGEDVNHGVDTVLLHSLRERHHPQTVAHELTVEELVHEVQLDNDVDKTQRLAEPVADRVWVVSL